MKLRKIMPIAFLAFLGVLVLAGGIFVAINSAQSKPEPVVEEDVGIKTFKDMFEQDIYEEVPAMIVEGTKIGDSVDYGQGNYLIDVNGTKVEDYQAYLKSLETAGFTKYVDNGEGLDKGAVLTATYTKESLVVTVTQLSRLDKTYISVSENLPLSDHLFYKDEYVANNKEGAKTTMSLLEQFEVGNSFVIQLKNGHFVISDGGVKEMLPYLLDYLEGLVPEGEKPVIEGWFFTHPHGDHTGVIEGFAEHRDYAARIVVEGIYYNTPGANAFTKDQTAATTSQNLTFGSMALRDSQGVAPKLYRIQTGQRYYFNDITIDIMMTQEQLLPEDYFADINEASTWCLCTIEGQKVVLTGDADKGSMKNVMRTYSQEYLSVEIISSFHHSVNTWNVFTDYCTASTVLVTRYGMNMNYEANHYLQTAVDEIISYVDGTKVLTFPYEVGKYKSLPNLQWTYHTEEQIQNRVIVK